MRQTNKMLCQTPLLLLCASLVSAMETPCVVLKGPFCNCQPWGNCSCASCGTCNNCHDCKICSGPAPSPMAPCSWPKPPCSCFATQKQCSTRAAARESAKCEWNANINACQPRPIRVLNQYNGTCPPQANYAGRRDTVLGWARQLLTGSFNAGGSYGGVFVRDANTFVDTSLDVTAVAEVRDVLLKLVSFQHASGDLGAEGVTLDHKTGK